MINEKDAQGLVFEQKVEKILKSPKIAAVFADISDIMNSPEHLKFQSGVARLSEEASARLRGLIAVMNCLCYTLNGIMDMADRDGNVLTALDIYATAELRNEVSAVAMKTRSRLAWLLQQAATYDE